LQTYLVGGAVRDKLLGLKVKEKDWVIVGSSPEEMIEKGFIPVGKSFPVFLHPKTHDEYALARTEKKIGKGYKGFEFYTAKNVTLEEDLKRRDLTINAMAMDSKGTIIDPYHGQEDLKNKILRHVSDAFIEDPVRILRIARFASKFGDFTIAPETMKLMKKMVKSGEVDALISERVWNELQRALKEDYPWRFIEILKECGALKIIFPEIDVLFGIPGPEKWHPEIDSGIHTLLALKIATKLSKSSLVRFATLTHDVGKGITPKELWPRHRGHGESGVKIIRDCCQRIRAPREYCELAVLVSRYHSHIQKLEILRPSTILKLLKRLDPFRRPERFKDFLLVCIADVKGRKGFENVDYEEPNLLTKIYKLCNKVNTKEIAKNFKGENIAKAIDAERLVIIKKFVKRHFK